MLPMLDNLYRPGYRRPHHLHDLSGFCYQSLELLGELLQAADGASLTPSPVLPSTFVFAEGLDVQKLSGVARC